MRHRVDQPQRLRLMGRLPSLTLLRSLAPTLERELVRSSSWGHLLRARAEVSLVLWCALTACDSDGKKGALASVPRERSEAVVAAADTSPRPAPSTSPPAPSGAPAGARSGAL